MNVVSFHRQFVRFYFVLVLLGLAALGSSQIPAASAQGGAATEVVVSLSVDQATFGAAEGVVLHVTMTNPSDHSITILKWLTPVNGLEEPLFLVTRDGEPVPYTGKLVKRPAPTELDTIVLNAGESLTAGLDLSLYYDLSASGNYAVAYDTSLWQSYPAAETSLLSQNALDLFIEGRTASAPSVSGGELQPLAVVGSTTFNGCSASRQTDLLNARNSASTYASHAVAYFAANKQGARYTTWFGVYNASRYSTVTSHFNALQNAIDNANPMHFDCTCTESWFAYVYPNQPYNVWLCNAFWPAPLTGTDSKAGTLIHEVSHFTAVIGTEDYVYGQTGAKNLAISNPAQAIMNADNHEYFAENNPPLETGGGNNNDDFGLASLFSSLPYTNTQSVAGYTTAGDDPTLTCSSAQRYLTAWYKYTPTQSQQLTVDTAGSDYDTVLAVWTGTRGNLTSVGCNDDGGANFTSLLSVNVTAGTTYYIEVVSYFASPAGTNLTLHASTNAVPPGAFAKTSPTNGATGQSTSPTLSWGSSSGVSSYEYCYDTTNNNACSSWVSTGGTASANLSGLTSNTTYYWQVRANNTNGTTYANGSSTAYWSFSTAGPTPPGAFAKTSPTNGATGQATNPTLSWGSSSGASSYEYCYDTTNDSACSSWVSTGSTASTNLSGLTMGATYYWQVRANNGYGTTYADGSSGSFWSFSVTADTVWSGTTSHGYAMSFHVDSSGTSWNTFKLKAHYVATNCYSTSGTLEITVPGPGAIVNNQFTVPGTSLSSSGQFTSPTTATGTYAITNLQIVVPLPGPPNICIYYFSETGTWNANIPEPPLISGNAGAGGATVNYTGGSTIADGNGNYSFRVPYGWSGTVTPSLPGVTFTPENRPYVNVTTDQVNQNYTAQVTISGNAGVAAATMNYTGGSTVANGSGNYTITVPWGWSGTVTPSLASTAFCPASQNYANLTASRTLQHYAHAACPNFGSISKWTASFDLSHGWTVSNFVRTVGDVSGDGRADLVGFGLDGVYVAVSNGAGFNPVSKWTSAFDLSHGWTVSDFVRTVGDVNGDGRADLVGFGLDGVYVSLSTGSSFPAPTKWTSSFDLSHGWTVSDFVRTVGDVNGDGRADLVGFGLDGVYVSLSTGSSFPAPTKWTSAFDLSHDWTVAQFVRTVGDVNGDGRADLVGFGLDGVYVATSTGSGFNAISKWTGSFALANGWTVSDFVRMVGDVNGDGKADVVGFGQDGVYVGLSTGSTFSLPSRRTTSFDLSHGWTVSDFVRTVGDVNGGGKADLVGFGLDGVYILLAQ